MNRSLQMLAMIALASACALAQAPAFAGASDCNTLPRAQKAVERLIKREDRAQLRTEVGFAFLADKSECLRAGGPAAAMEAVVLDRLTQLDARLARASDRLAAVTKDGESYVMVDHDGSMHELGTDYERQVDSVTIVLLNRSSIQQAKVEIDLQGEDAPTRTIRMNRAAPVGRLMSENWDLYDWSPKEGTLRVGEVRMSDADGLFLPQRVHVAEPSSTYANGVAVAVGQHRFLTRIAAELAAKRTKRMGRVAAAKITRGFNP